MYHRVGFMGLWVSYTLHSKLYIITLYYTLHYIYTIHLHGCRTRLLHSTYSIYTLYYTYTQYNIYYVFTWL
ncbi:hypothetical protein B484DRAFT_458362 [Ochromonadaceae sp. CCMP2298]|nr:hypothetical protein B484DRAFT_458362 [Ochromonadaceae sp. CCMP2298]